MKKYLVLLLSLVTLQSYGMNIPELTPEEEAEAKLQADVQEALAEYVRTGQWDTAKTVAALQAVHAKDIKLAEQISMQSDQK